MDRVARRKEVRNFCHNPEETTRRGLHSRMAVLVALILREGIRDLTGECHDNSSLRTLRSPAAAVIATVVATTGRFWNPFLCGETDVAYHSVFLGFLFVLLGFVLVFVLRRDTSHHNWNWNWGCSHRMFAFYHGVTCYSPNTLCCKYGTSFWLEQQERQEAREHRERERQS